jgi:hypothetical protein
VLLLAGCPSEDNQACAKDRRTTFHLAGEVRIADSAKAASEPAVTGGAIVVVAENYADKIQSCSANRVSATYGGGPSSVAAVALSGGNTFQLDFTIDSYRFNPPAIRVYAYLDANEDGQCSAGELEGWGTIQSPDDDEIEIELEVLGSSGCPRHYF